MGATDRIKQYLDIKGITKYQFNKKLGFSNKFLDNSNNMGTDKACKILHYYPEINPKWLLTGEGDMIHGTPSKSLNEEREPYHLLNKKIPLIPVEAMAGWGNGDVQIMDYDTETYVVPEFEQLNVDFMIRVKGSSMIPKYNSGDLIACKKVPTDTFFQWNKVYVLSTIQGALVKRIHQSNQDGYVCCVSDNKEYKPFDLDVKEIHSIALVVGVIRLE